MLGDVLTSTVIADQLKQSFPSSIIDYLIIDNAHAIVKNHPSINATILVKKSDLSSLGGIIALSRKLKKNNYDLLIDAYCKNNSALLSTLSGIPKRIGYNKWFSKLAYTQAVENKPDPRLFPTGLSIGSRLILTQPVVDHVQWDLKPKIRLTAQEKSKAREWLIEKGLDVDQKITMVSVMGSAVDKTLPFDKMATLLDNFVQRSNSQLLFNYIPSQKEQVMQVYNLCDRATKNHIFIDAFAPSIRAFIAVLSQCDAIIGNEGGAINMAKAVGIPTFAIFSPWITKRVWNVSEDGKHHICIHLKDQIPQLYQSGNNKIYKKESLKMYAQYDIQTMMPQIEHFIKMNLL